MAGPKSKETTGSGKSKPPSDSTKPIPQTDGASDAGNWMTYEQGQLFEDRERDRDNRFKKLDLSFSAIVVSKDDDPEFQELDNKIFEGVPSRPKMSTLGTPIKIGLNQFPVEELFPPGTIINQYDVTFSSLNKSPKRGLCKMVWESPTVQGKFADFLWDGNKLAWSRTKLRHSETLIVDLDVDYKKTPRAGREGQNKHKMLVRHIKEIKVNNFVGYLNGDVAFDKGNLEVLNFFDHLLRHTPSKTLKSHKRSFFERGDSAHSLGGNIEAWKGVYSSVRVGHHNANGKHTARLSVNVDVSNGVFFEADRKLTDTAVKLSGRRDLLDFQDRVRTQKDKYGKPSNAASRTSDGKVLRRFNKLRVYAGHRGKKIPDEYVIDKFIWDQDAKQATFKRKENGVEKKITIFDYYRQTYKITLEFWHLPLVVMTKGEIVPMELLKISKSQRYPFKLDDKQTSEMIKFAVTPPAERYRAIEHGLGLLNWANDRALKNWGMKISTKRMVVDARLLPAPIVKFGVGEARPGTSGRWDLMKKKFYKPAPAPLKCWAVVALTNNRGKPQKEHLDKFIAELIRSFESHGGRVENKRPYMAMGSIDDPGAAVTTAWNGAGNQAQFRPQLLVFVLPDKNSIVYGKIKRSADCRYGVVSQCVQYSNAQKCSPQYLSNVCMKVNAKLGGITCRAVGPKSGGPDGQFSKKTMIIGADVSHAAPGAQMPSMAAMTVSQDQLATRYAAACENNGFRVEMINPHNIRKMLKPMVDEWLRNVGGGKVPPTIIYFRDGVAETQYPQILAFEVPEIRELFKSYAREKLDFKIIVLVASKRHHVRFFPERGDRNGNAMPGTLVETGATNPFENDFYLCSHAAIKGTARPMHYHVLLNEPGMDNNELQTLIYEQCYQYIRATTPVSQHPAVYYAHLASNRAIPHDPKWNESMDPATKKKADAAKNNDGSATPVQPECHPLLPLPNLSGFPVSMWYI